MTGTTAGWICDYPLICCGDYPQVSISKSFSFNRYYADGRYGAVQTITGHYQYSDGAKRMFDTPYSESTLYELCLPTQAQVDGHYFGRPLVSPETTYPYGGYTTDLWACPYGQALEWEWSWNWANAKPYVEPYSDAGIACVKIRAPLLGSWPPSYGWCED